MTDLNEKRYEELLQSDKPLLVEYWAPWCVYCRRIVPAMEQVAKRKGESVTVGRINIDDFPTLAQQERIEVVPTMIIYRGGKSLGSIVAPESKAKIEEFIKETLNQ